MMLPHPTGMLPPLFKAELVYVKCSRILRWTDTTVLEQVQQMLLVGAIKRTQARLYILSVLSQI